MTEKGPGSAHEYDASSLRIGIIHGRWNTAIIESLLSGCKQTLKAAGVPEANIVTQSCPGSYELPLATQRMLSASQTTSSSTLVSAATDLLGGGSSTTDLTSANTSKGTSAGTSGPGGPFDAVIAIGVLIKGSTMHFEYIADAVTHGLMRVQLDTGVPVIFGVLTCLDEDQARTRAGLSNPTGPTKPPASGPLSYGEQGHNHGVDWAKAAVEMASKRKAWGEGRFIE